METCYVGLFYLALVLSSSEGAEGQNQLLWPQIDLRASGVQCNVSSAFTGDGFQTDCHAAINGNTNRTYTRGNCIHTGYDDRSPFWWVDMGRTYGVYRIRIYTRSQNEYRSSYLTVTIDQQEVYASPRNLSLSAEYLDINSPPLPVTGRYLQITRHAPRSLLNYYINICEVQVWGCRPGWWGSRCHQCVPRCASGQCYQDTGCRRCVANFVLPLCTVCDAGRYGQHCEERCSNGCNGPCNTTDGTCTCLTGWAGVRCQACAAGYYKTGTTPVESCAPCGSGCVDGKCADGNGTCTCLPGWHPDTCSTPCDTGRYGLDCEERCSNGCNGPCNTTDGTCSCLTGWTGDRCQVSSAEKDGGIGNVGPVMGAVIGGSVLIAISVVVAALIVR